MKDTVSFYSIKVWLERFVYLSVTAVLIFSSYTLYSNSFWASFIKEIHTDLSAVATVSSLKGDALQKTRFDMLWLPSKKNKTIWDGDLYSTSSESLAEISISETLKLFLEPDTLVRLKRIDNKPLIRLSQGSIKAEFSEDQSILIKKGVKIEEVFIRKGTYFIKNEATIGIQITNFDSELKKLDQHKVNDNKKAAVKFDEEEALTKNSNQSSTTEETRVDRVYDLPTPEENTIFFVNKPRQIIISASENCADLCSLDLYKDGVKIISKKFKKQDPSYLTLTIDSKSLGKYEWTFESEISNFRSQFEVKLFSQNEIDSALSQEKPIDIHD